MLQRARNEKIYKDSNKDNPIKLSVIKVRQHFRKSVRLLEGAHTDLYFENRIP